MSTNKVDWAAEVQSAVLAMKTEGQKAYTYVKEEAPEVGAEYVRWKLAENAITAAACVLGAVLLAVVCEKLRRAGNRSHDPGPWYFGLVGVAITSMWLAGLSVPFVIKATKCLVAPRVVIIEGIREVVR